MASNRMLPGSEIELSHAPGRVGREDRETLVHSTPGGAAVSPFTPIAPALTALPCTASPHRPALGEALPPFPPGLIGGCPAMERLFLQMRYLAGHLRLAFLDGEPGSGRRTIAEALHAVGPGRASGFLASDAGELLSSRVWPAALARVSGGTLYLRGVEALAAPGQELLQRVLRWVRGSHGAAEGLRALLAGEPGPDRALSAPGGGLPEPCWERPPRAVLVSAEQPLPRLAAQGLFRADLTQQLVLVQLRIPPLRDRGVDIAELAHRFARDAAALAGKAVDGLTAEAVQRLQGQQWPGNLRELRAVMEDAIGRARGRWLEAGDLQLPWPGPERGMEADLSFALDMAADGLVLEKASVPASKPACREASSTSAGSWTLKKSSAGAAHEQGAGPSADVLYRSQCAPRTSSKLPGDEGSRPRSERRGGTHADAEVDPNLDRAILRHIQKVLERARGNKVQAARLLGISRSTLYRLLGNPEPKDDSE